MGDDGQESLVARPPDHPGAEGDGGKVIAGVVSSQNKPFCFGFGFRIKIGVFLRVGVAFIDIDHILAPE